MTSPSRSICVMSSICEETVFSYNPAVFYLCMRGASMRRAIGGFVTQRWDMLVAQRWHWVRLRRPRLGGEEPAGQEILFQEVRISSSFQTPRPFPCNRTAPTCVMVHPYSSARP